MLQCGSEYIEWQAFADALYLFVVAETATHRLSEVMKKDPRFYHIPHMFGDVKGLGASLLVDATSNLFRRMKDGKREPLLSLEYLVSTLSVFEATEPRDTIFILGMMWLLARTAQFLTHARSRLEIAAFLDLILISIPSRYLRIRRGG